MATNQGFDVSVDQIFITGLPEDITEDELAEHFGQIGVIKYDKKNECKKIWIYKDKSTGKGKGEATITYDDPPTATSAIDWFNGKEFRGSTLTVQLAQRKSVPQFNRGRGRGGGGGYRGEGGRPGGGYDSGDRSGGRSGPGRPGDWLCPSCSNNNFAYRQECNRCRTQKPSGGGESGHDSGGGGGSGYHHNGGGRHYDDASRGNYRGSGGGRSYNRDNDFRDRPRDRANVDRDSYRDRDRDRDRDRGRGGGGGGHGYGQSHGYRQEGSGPSRNNARGKDDRRQRPY